MGNAEKQTKQKIMEIAKEHFSRYGYAGTNLEAIGKEAGVTRGPLYYYFKNKKELYAAVIEQEKIHVVDQYKQIFEQACSIYEKLEKDIIYCSSSQSLLRQIGVGGQGEPEIPMQDYSQKVYQIKEEAMQKAVDKGELRADAKIEEMLQFLYIFVYGMTELRKTENSELVLKQRTLIQDAQMFVELFSARYGA
ncbi:TetR/AcrR family transcriptional regulator [Holdemania massiliensis]|uniref:TetR/AcrR family transcriptional regulator n=1 Tax=Holdemania massiliensis TaxID=1468449 RepID=UPI001F0692FB|nr:TetR family transcriptional regulator [Holdemania massiliensis]MCH1939776.1 TetR family transcriptional regulator [Holdemania massiliensis]